LKIFVKEFAITGEAIRIILAGILSIPVDLQGFKDKRSIYFGLRHSLELKVACFFSYVIRKISVTVIDSFGNIWTNISKIIIETFC
jgi:hypothetical protein